MVLVMALGPAETRGALQAHMAEASQSDLNKTFAAWLLREPEQAADFASIADRAAKKEGADQDFQTAAILGFAAEAGVLSKPQLGTLKKSLLRLAGRNPVINGVPMAFCGDAVGVLGVIVGTRALSDADVTSQIARWAAKFLKTSYEREGGEEWQRCLFAVAGRYLDEPLDLAIPESAATADVRTALLSRGLVDAADEDRAREDEVQTLNLAVQQLPTNLTHDRAALRLAAFEWVIGACRRPAEKRDRATDATNRTEGASQKSDRVGDVLPAQEAHAAKEIRTAKKPVRRNQKYEAIDRALRQFAAARPKSHEEVFRLLEDRKIPIPHRRPFKSAGGWLKGRQNDRHSASVWLSQAWGRLGLPTFPRGPRK